METEERQIWSTGRRGFAGEPLFIPRPNATDEDDGWVLAVILDAKDLSREPIARLHLKHHIPYALHGSFTDKVFIE
ncbi:Retinal pigment epithelial membrane protein [Richelia intracellularis]|nr:Retinal pigment epithelial membrane protein [Richelia intracellularis]